MYVRHWPKHCYMVCECRKTARPLICIKVANSVAEHWTETQWPVASHFPTAMNWMFVSPLKFVCWNPNPSVILLGDGAGGDEVIRVGLSWMELVLLWKRPQRALEPNFCHMRTQKEVSSLPPGKALSPGPHHAGTLVLHFQPPELWETNFCCL